MAQNLTDNWQLAKILTDNWHLYPPSRPSCNVIDVKSIAFLMNLLAPEDSFVTLHMRWRKVCCSNSIHENGKQWTKTQKQKKVEAPWLLITPWGIHSFPRANHACAPRWVKMWENIPGAVEGRWVLSLINLGLPSLHGDLFRAGILVG